MNYVFLLLALVAAPLHAAEAPIWTTEPPPAVVIKLAEPASDEVVVVINDNAFGGNHAGLFAGSLLIDPAGSYVGVRGEDATWQGPTLADYARYQTVDGPNIRFYRFRLQPQAFASIEQRIRASGLRRRCFVPRRCRTCWWACRRLTHSNTLAGLHRPNWGAYSTR